MSVVTVALLVGFVGCALLIRVLVTRGSGRAEGSWSTEVEPVRVWRSARTVSGVTVDE